MSKSPSDVLAEAAMTLDRAQKALHAARAQHYPDNTGTVTPAELIRMIRATDSMPGVAEAEAVLRDAEWRYVLAERAFRLHLEGLTTAWQERQAGAVEVTPVVDKAPTGGLDTWDF